MFSTAQERDFIAQMMWWNRAITHLRGNIDCNDLWSRLL